jgi:pimeloyl-ACP methyl ester carboxylesterase
MKTPPLVLIHGYPFDHTMWDLVLKELGETTVIAPDLPGFGDDPVENAEPSIDVFADDIANLLDLHNATTAVVAGMSMGGYVALAFAEKYPERLAGLGLISTHAAADTEEVRQNRRNTIAQLNQQGASAAAEALIPKLFSPANQGNSRLTPYAREGAAKAGVSGLSWALEAMARRPDRSAVAATLRIPALVLHGAQDTLIPPERARRLAGQMPDSRYVELHDAGHASPLECPKEVAEALKDLVQRASRTVRAQPLPKPDRPAITIGPTEKGL